jgi:uncharacterized protein YjdB
VVTLLGLSFAVALGCGDGAGSDASVHGAVTGVGDGRASTIQVSPATATVEEGAIASLSCLALDSRGVVVSSSHGWTISDPTVATVAANGAVAAQHPGTAVVSCTVDGKTAAATVTVVASPVAFLEVTPGAGVLVLGKSLQLVGTPLDSNGAVVADHRVQWTTADSAIATVSPTGAVVGHVEGTANVIAVSGGKAAFAKINVAKQPPAPVGSISIRLDDATLNVGQLAHASATTTDVNGQVVTGRSISWSVDQSSVITAVSTAGDKANITGRGQGTAVLTATSEGQSASVTVTVAMAPVQTVTVSLASTNILPGQTTQATAQLKDALGNVLTGRTVTWSSLDPSIATVSAVGVVTGVSTGAVIIRATSEGQTGDGTETVGSAPVATVTVNLASTSLAPGQTTQATAVARDANGNVLTGRSVSWSSLNTGIATVSTSGVVTAVAAGSATIQATVETKIGTTGLTVTSTTAPAPVATVSVTLGATSLAPGQTTQATAVARDASGNVLTGRIVAWSAVNPGIATVSTSGLVTAVTAGSATIRATVETKVGDGTLTVTAPVTATTAAVVATVDSATLAPGHSAQGHAVAKDAQGNVLTGKTVSWSSNNTAIATVSATTGLVTAVSAGSALVQATVDGVAGQASVNVTVPSIITAPAPTTLVSHDFEDGTFGQYWNPWGQGIDVIADPTNSGHGKVARYHYLADGVNQVDDNKALTPTPKFSIGLGDSIWFRGDFYLPSTVIDDPTIAMRKLIYWGLKSSFPHEFSLILALAGSQLEPISTVVGPSNLPLDYTYTGFNVTKGVWHRLEVQLQLNSTFAAQNGILRIWIDRALVYDRTNMRWTDPAWTEDPSTYRWETWGVGYQAQMHIAYDEYRYWDNVAFAKTRLP